MNNPTPTPKPEETIKEIIEKSLCPDCGFCRIDGVCECEKPELVSTEEMIDHLKERGEFGANYMTLKAADRLTSQAQKIERQHVTIKRNVKLIKKIGYEKRLLMDLIRDHVDETIIIEMAEKICSRSKELETE